MMTMRTLNMDGINRFSRRQLIFMAAAAMAGSALAGCSTGGTVTTGGGVAQVAQPAAQVNAASAAAGATSVVHMTDQLKFDPATITVKAGTTIEWQNTSTTVHTVTDDPSKAQNPSDAALPNGAQPWDSGMINPGQTYRRTFTVAGQYSYFCIPHESMGMVGKIVVQ